MKIRAGYKYSYNYNGGPSQTACLMFIFLNR